MRCGHLSDTATPWPPDREDSQPSLCPRTGPAKCTCWFYRPDGGTPSCWYTRPRRATCGTSGWSFCSRLPAMHADTGDAWAASIRPGMGQFVASMRREMDVPEQVEAYLASQPEPKQADLRRLHAHILAEFPGCRLWFTDGTNADGKVVANPNIGYGACTITYADGSSREFYRIGLSANTTGISVYVLGLDDKTY